MYHKQNTAQQDREEMTRLLYLMIHSLYSVHLKSRAEKSRKMSSTILTTFASPTFVEGIVTSEVVYAIDATRRDATCAQTKDYIN